MAHYALVSTPRELYFDGPSLDDLAAADDESYDIGGTTSPAWRAVLDEASDAKAGKAFMIIFVNFAFLLLLLNLTCTFRPITG